MIGITFYLNLTPVLPDTVKVWLKDGDQLARRDSQPIITHFLDLVRQRHASDQRTCIFPGAGLARLQLEVYP